MKRVFGSGRYANVTATVALVVALGGTSYAAVALPKNSVGSAQIKRNGVANSDIRGNAVTSSKVANGSLQATDFKAGQLPKGPQGLPGAAGAPGAPGAPGSARAYARVIPAATPVLDPAYTKNITAVSRAFTGVYCLTPAAGIAGATSPAIATVDWLDTDDPEGDASAMFEPASGGSCPAGTVAIHTERATSATAAASSDTVAFLVLLP